jgi:2-amino-4-hydroxy-6-hydroxymethyldihydropteridine diphosphokinase
MQPELVRATIALGSNLGDRRAHLAAAVAALRADPDVRVVAVSAWHETAPVGGPPGQGDFLNGAVEVETALGARELLRRLPAIERARGRERGAARAAPRTLDLDLILYGDEVHDEPDRVVPHPRAAERDFVLRPMAEIAPERRFPPSGRTVRQELARLGREARRG